MSRAPFQPRSTTRTLPPERSVWSLSTRHRLGRGAAVPKAADRHADRYGDEDRQNKDGSFCDVVIDSALARSAPGWSWARAPLSASDFLRYLDQGLYAGRCLLSYRSTCPTT